MDPKLPPGSVLGHKRRSRQVAGLILTEACYAADVELAPHCHENAFFALMLRGNGSDTTTRGTFSGGPATLIYHPAGETHANRWYEAGSCFMIELGHAARDRLGDYAERLSSGSVIFSGPAVQLALQAYSEFCHFDGVSPLALEGLVLELSAAVCRSALIRQRQTAPNWLRGLQQVLRDRLDENLSLLELAASVGLHPGHLVRVFRRHCRCTPGQYVRRLRVEEACRELARGKRSLAEIALTTGFSDQSHLSTTFKRHTGLTPAQFRKSLQRR